MDGRGGNAANGQRFCLSTGLWPARRGGSGQTLRRCSRGRPDAGSTTACPFLKAFGQKDLPLRQQSAPTQNLVKLSGKLSDFFCDRGAGRGHGAGGQGRFGPASVC